MSNDNVQLSVPYRGPEEFRFVDHAIFSERDQEVWEILQLITLYRGIVVYGESGNGKSSLVNAGLIPELVRQGYAVDRVRVQYPPNGEFLVERISRLEEGTAPFLESGLIQGTTGEKSKTLTDGEFAEALHNSPNSKRRLLVFDQFEEIVTHFEEAPELAGDDRLAARGRILARLESLLDSDSIAVKLLFVFREDYMAPIRSLLSRRPEVFRQYYWLRAPSTDKTRAIIEQPLKLFQFHERFDEALTRELAAQLNSRARKGAVNLTDLQIACLELWRTPQPAKVLGDLKVGGLIQNYLTRALEPLNQARLREPAIALLGTMITPYGTRNVISEYDAIARVSPMFQVPEEQLRAALDGLVKTRLVRKSLEGEGTYYEVSSDFLSTWINENRLEQEARLLRARTERQARARSRAAYLFLVLSASLLLLFCLFLYSRMSARSEAKQQQQLLQAAEETISLLQKEKTESDHALRVLSARQTVSKKGGTGMFGSDTLEVVIGVIFLVSLLSLICMALNEVVATFLQSRARVLRNALKNLLRDDQRIERLYRHPLIKPLAPEGNPPSYIPSRTFAMAILDIVAPAKVGRIEGPAEIALRGLSAEIFTLPDSDFKQSLLVIVSQSHSQEELYRNIESWFSNAMDAVAGSYKRLTQIQLVLLSLLLTVAVNVDMLAVIQALYSSSSIRAVVDAAARDYAQTVEKTSDSSTSSKSSVAERLLSVEEQAQLPITWSGATSATRRPRTRRDWFQRVLGWLFTAIPVAVCAQVWFFVLNGFAGARFTIKPYNWMGRDEREWAAKPDM